MDPFVDFFQKTLRASLFTGFLTLTGFLFTLHTFLLVTLHRDIYGRPDYQEWVITRRRQYNPDSRPLQPLRNVSRLLFAMLCCSFITSISQLSVGLFDSLWAVGWCIAWAIGSVVLFAFMLWIFRLVILDWLDFVEQNAEKTFGQSGGTGNNEEPADDPQG